MRTHELIHATRIIVAVVVPTGVAPMPGHAQTYERTIERAMARSMEALPGVLQGQSIGFGDLRDGVAKANCEPLSTVLRDAAIQGVSKQRLALKTASYQYINEVNYLIWGEWFRTHSQEITVEFRLVMPSASGMEATELGKQSAKVDIETLPPTARHCMVQVEETSQRMKADSRLSVYDAPTNKGKVVAEIQPGEELWLTGKVRGSDWKVVRLSEDRKLPMGYRERRGFVLVSGVEGALRDARLDRHTAPFVITLRSSGQTPQLTADQSQRVVAAIQEQLNRRGIKTSALPVGGDVGTAAMLDQARANGQQGIILITVDATSWQESPGVQGSSATLRAEVHSVSKLGLLASAQGQGRTLGGSDVAASIVTAAVKSAGEVAGTLAERILAGLAREN